MTKALKTYSRKPREQDAALLEGAEKLCRLCLEELQGPQQSIFAKASDVGISLATRITLCVGLEMTQVESLPDKICYRCYKELDRCYRFRKKCEASYQRLKLHLLAKNLERTKDMNRCNQPQNQLESNLMDCVYYQNHNRNIVDYSYHSEEISDRNDEEMLVHSDLKPQDLNMDYDSERMVQPTDMGPGVVLFPQPTTSSSALQFNVPQSQTSILQSKSTIISPTLQLPLQPTQISPTPQLQSEPTQIFASLQSFKNIIKRIIPSPPLQLNKTLPPKCPPIPPLQSQPSYLRIPQPSLMQSQLVQPQISQLPTSTSQPQTLLAEPKLQIATTQKDQQQIDWVLIDPPTPQSQSIPQPTLKLHPLNIPTKKSPIRTVDNSQLQNSSKSVQSRSICTKESACKHNPPPNMTLSSLLENILTCVGAIHQESDLVSLNGVTEVDLTMGEGTVINMELVEEDSDDSITAEDTPVVKMVRVDSAQNKTKNSSRKWCSICEMSFASSSTRARHERDVHGCARPYACSTCGAAFAQRSVLTRHLYTHMETRPFACKKCPKTFAQRGSLHIHARSHEPKHVRDAQVKRCPIHNCNKVFQFSSGLSRHMQWHEGRQFVCHACFQGFTDKSALQRHLRSDKHKRKAGRANVHYKIDKQIKKSVVVYNVK